MSSNNIGVTPLTLLLACITTAASTYAIMSAVSQQQQSSSTSSSRKYRRRRSKDSNQNSPYQDGRNIEGEEREYDRRRTLQVRVQLWDIQNRSCCIVVG